MKTLSKLSLVAVAATVLAAGSASATECPDFTSGQMKNIIGDALEVELSNGLGDAGRKFRVQKLRQAVLRESGGKCYVDTVSEYSVIHLKLSRGTVNYRLELLSDKNNEVCFGAGKLTGGQFSGGPAKRALDKKRAGRAAPTPFCASY